MQEWIEFRACPKLLLLLGGGSFRGLFGDGTYLDCLLHLFDGAREVSGRLWEMIVGASLGGMSKEETCEVVLIFPGHLLVGLLEMFVAVEKDVVAGDEGLILPGYRSILLVASGRHQEQQKEY